jgi:hypothetical protein
MKPSTFGALVAGAFVGIAGCRSARVEPAPPPQPPPPVVVVERQGGPPPHAPAHGYRRKFQYAYYPSTAVYTCPTRSLWFWVEGGGWRFGAQLPTTIRVDAGEAVTIDLDDDKPYVAHAEHKKKFPPGQAKKKGKGKG